MVDAGEVDAIAGAVPHLEYTIFFDIRQFGSAVLSCRGVYFFWKMKFFLTRPHRAGRLQVCNRAQWRKTMSKMAEYAYELSEALGHGGEFNDHVQEVYAAGVKVTSDPDTLLALVRTIVGGAV